MRQPTSRPEHDRAPGQPARPDGHATATDAPPAPADAQVSDDADRERWAQMAREIERLNQADPHAGVARAERWLAEEPDGEGRARALRSLAYALRVSGQYGSA